MTSPSRPRYASFRARRPGREVLMTAAKRQATKAPVLVRGEPVVRGILEATMAELAEVGYGALRIEEVAARAGVNKTTVYRRWPTKPELVLAALRSITVDRIITQNTGSLRGDLLAVARHMATLMGSTEGRTLKRLLFVEDQNPEFAAIAQSLRDTMHSLPATIIEAALARGEIAEGVDPVLLFDVLAGTMEHRIFMERRSVDEAFFEQVVSLLLFGALAPDKRKAHGVAETRGA